MEPAVGALTVTGNVTGAVCAAWAYSVSDGEFGVIEGSAFRSSVTLLSKRLAIAISGLPSALKSATTKETGVDPVLNGLPVRAVKPPDPSPSRTVMLFPPAFAATTSGTPSPLKSASAKAWGLTPTAKGLAAAATNAPVPSPSSTVTVLSAELAARMSGLPSPFRSPSVIATGPAPTETGLAGVAVNPPKPLPSRIVSELPAKLATTRSCLPSPLTSPTATNSGDCPVLKGLPAERVNPPVPLPSSTVTVLSPELAVTISAFPSPLKSPTPTKTGVDPTANGLPATCVNLPEPLPSSTVTVLSPELAATISALPSPLKSPTATNCGFIPTAKGLPVASVNPPEPLPSNTVTLLPTALTVTRSGLPSALKSPVATAWGLAPAGNGLAEAGVNWARAANGSNSKAILSSARL